MNESLAMRNMRIDIANRLVRIEDEFRRLGIPMTNITLIARDPANDNMFVCLTNEEPAGLEHACKLAINQGK